MKEFKFSHLRVNGKYRATIAFKQTEDNDKIIVYGVAVSSDTEPQVSRKKGRQKAVNRLKAVLKPEANGLIEWKPYHGSWQQNTLLDVIEQVSLNKAGYMPMDEFIESLKSLRVQGY